MIKAIIVVQNDCNYGWVVGHLNPCFLLVKFDTKKECKDLGFELEVIGKLRCCSSIEIYFLRTQTFGEPYLG